MKNTNLYINLCSGEVYITKNLRKAVRYFTKDAKAYGYPFSKEMVIHYTAYLMSH